MEIEIYVVTHKEYRFPAEGIYRPIIAGACSSVDERLLSMYQRDDTGDHISDKHDSFSEYTVNYWAWKNTNADIVGINHYRRYFIKGGWGSYYFVLHHAKERVYDFALKKKDIEKIFAQGYNCILPKKQWRLGLTAEEQYKRHHSADLLEDAVRVISQQSPAYMPAVEQVLASVENYQKCICIMTKEMFDDYTAWFYAICSELEKMGYGTASREFAFLGERLMNVWVAHKKSIGDLRVKEMFFVNVESTLAQRRTGWNDEQIYPHIRALYTQFRWRLNYQKRRMIQFFSSGR